jgi:hypothetical protein
MSVCVLHDEKHDLAALYCSSSDFAFGPVFSANHGKDATERAEAFLRWIDANPKPNATSRLFDRFDVRHLNDQEISLAYSEWLAQEEQQYTREQTPEPEEA